MKLSETPKTIQQAYPKPDDVQDVIVTTSDQGETYTVRLKNGRNDTWKRQSFWWKLVKQGFSEALRRGKAKP